MVRLTPRSASGEIAAFDASRRSAGGGRLYFQRSAVSFFNR